MNITELDHDLSRVTRKKNAMNEGPPWPLTQEEIDLFKSKSMKELSFELIPVDEKTIIADMKFRVLYQK